uniref:V-SNARE coiled-coil homology domain-containing protein n=1 Tax=Arion vulgaris TaxID=1028688 RepID=A0A0B6ZFF2_9EUPU
MARVGGGRNTQLNHLENEVSEVTSLLRDNVEKVLDRGERIDTLQSRSEDLESSSSHFRSSAVKIRKKMWWQNCKMTCIVATVIGLIIVIIVVVILVETKPWESSGGGGKHNGTKLQLHHATTFSTTTIQ